MKIIKKNEFGTNIFDTYNTAFCEPYNNEAKGLIPLHHSHNLSDYSFLKSFFPLEHQIFNNFGKSYYYVLGEQQDILEKEAVSEIIAFGKSELTEVTPELVSKLNNALEFCNGCSTTDIAIMHREIAARQLLIMSISSLTKSQLDKADSVVLAIACNKNYVL